MPTQKKVQLNVNRRKFPSQERAQATINTLLEATAQILIQDGYDRLSTNRIAKEAGFSIGSLYQYFSSKESIVAALIDRQLNADYEKLKSVMESSQSLPIEDSARNMIRALIEIFGKNRKLRRVIYEQVPRLSREQKRKAIESALRDQILKNMEARFQEMGRKPSEMSIFVIVRAVLGVIISAMLEDSQLMTEREFEDELVQLIMGFAYMKISTLMDDSPIKLP